MSNIYFLLVTAAVIIFSTTVSMLVWKFLYGAFAPEGSFADYVSLGIVYSNGAFTTQSESNNLFHYNTNRIALKILVHQSDKAKFYFYQSDSTKLVLDQWDTTINKTLRYESDITQHRSDVY